MGALYVKDDDALQMAERLASSRGLTKVAAVKLALANELAKDRVTPSLLEVVRELRRTSKLPPSRGIITDKAFYDSLYDGE